LLEIRSAGKRNGIDRHWTLDRLSSFKTLKKVTSMDTTMSAQIFAHTNRALLAKLYAESAIACIADEYCQTNP
jgi:hypothetical protein